MTAKILVFDIETAPMTGKFWGQWKQNIALNQIDIDWYVLSWAAKWLGKDEVLSDSLFEYEDYRPFEEEDYNILTTIWELLDEADIVVAHNGRQFDVKKLNARFLKYGMKPPSPFKIVDTLEVVKKNFRLTSNKLDYVAKYLKVGGKLSHEGMELWNKCVRGEEKAWEKMVEYNRRDVVILERVYNKLLPWISNHPNLGLYTSTETPVCPKCGGHHLHFRGYYYTNVSKFHRFQCQSCGGWGRQRVNAVPKKKRKGLVMGAML